MFDGIHRPEGQTQKPKSAAWAQPVTEVHSSSNPSATPEAIHPVKPTSSKPNFLPILLGILVLAVLGGGAYWWWTNYYIVEEPVVADKAMMQAEEEGNNDEMMGEEQLMEEESGLVFPDDYFLNEEEIPEGFDYDEEPDNLMEELDVVIATHIAIKENDIEGAWAFHFPEPFFQDDSDEQGINLDLTNSSNVAIYLKYNSQEKLAEIFEDINNSKEEVFFIGEEIHFIKQNDVLVIVYGTASVDKLQKIVDAIKTKVDSFEYIFIEKVESKPRFRAYELLPSSDDIILCYLVENQSDLDYFPEGKLRTDMENSIENISSKKQTECPELLEQVNVINDFKEDLYKDTDEDGLAYYFEELYGSDDKNKDTDDDGYDDYTEVKNGYSPVLNEAEIEIFVGESGISYIEYTNEEFNFSLWRPKDWTVKEDLMFKVGSDDTFLIQFCPKFGCLGTEEYVAIILSSISAEVPEEDIFPVEELEAYILGGMEAYTNEDVSAVILVKESLVSGKLDSISIQYDYSMEGEPNPEHMIIFQEMLASFKFLQE